MKNIDDTIGDSFKEHMLRWDLPSFKATHPRLLKSIKSAMEKYAAQKCKEQRLNCANKVVESSDDKVFNKVISAEAPNFE